jgi:hypothetical protein
MTLIVCTRTLDRLPSWHASAMAFWFTETQYPGQDHSHSGSDWFEFGPGGILGVHFGDSDRDSEYYAPNAWTNRRTDQPPGPLTDSPVWGFNNAG